MVRDAAKDTNMELPNDNTEKTYATDREFLVDNNFVESITFLDNNPTAYPLDRTFDDDVDDIRQVNSDD